MFGTKWVSEKIGCLKMLSHNCGCLKNVGVWKSEVSIKRGCLEQNGCLKMSMWKRC